MTSDGKLTNVCFNSSAQKFMAKTTQKSDHPWSAIFSAIVYCHIFAVNSVNKYTYPSIVWDFPGILWGVRIVWDLQTSYQPNKLLETLTVWVGYTIKLLKWTHSIRNHSKKLLQSDYSKHALSPGVIYIVLKICCTSLSKSYFCIKK